MPTRRPEITCKTKTLFNIIYCRYQALRFALIGALAALVHLGMVYLLVEMRLFNPLAANILAFFMAFQVSYWGHKQWTFRDFQAPKKQSWPRFLSVALLAFILNEYLFYLFLHYTHLPYLLNLVIVLMIVPPLTFIASKCWAFKPTTLQGK